MHTATTPSPAYHAPWWLPDPHSQTLWPLLEKQAIAPYRRERWDTPDADFIDLDWLAGGDDEAPLVLLFHGLEGSSHSHYARTLMHAVRARGWRGVVAHFRGCSGSANRLARAYHAGDSAEIDWIVERMQGRAGRAPLFIVGVSLGGNALLKWLGEHGAEACSKTRAAAAVCASLDLPQCGAALDRGVNRVYTWHFLRTLKRKALAKCSAFGGHFDAPRIAQATTLHAFDDAYTAPAHGFTDVDDYWRRASARPLLGAIAAPTLLLHANNDPFVPPAAVPAANELSAQISVERSAGGGHVGFVGGRFPGTQHWLGERVLAHFAAFA